MQLLREYRQHQKAERFKVGSEWVRRVEIENGKTVDNDLLFTRWNGQPFDPNAVQAGFQAFWPPMTSRRFTSTACATPTPAC